MDRIPCIALSGGPCGGKTTFLVRAREWLLRYGIRPLVVSETATELIAAGAGPDALGIEAFQERLLLYTLDREDHYRKIAEAIPGQKTVLLCDRGVLDCAAYMGTGPYRLMLKRLGLSQNSLMHRYDLMVHLVTAAEGAEKHYTLANNAARRESQEEARALDKRTREAWYGHPHHLIIDNSTDFANKMLRALRALARTLDMPEPTEIERKFRITNFQSAFIPREAVAVQIIQYYLKHDGPGERRVRRRTQGGGSTYFYTEKEPTGKRATRVERERQITEAEYNAYLKERDRNLHAIRKTRHQFEFRGHLLEVDVFQGHQDGLVIAEVELRDPDEFVELPKEWKVKEVTDDPHYKNRALARAKK